MGLFADKLKGKTAIKLSLGKNADDGESPEIEGPTGKKEEHDEKSYAVGELGSMAMKAMKQGDGEAFEEAMRKLMESHK
jgi:hypothetical protein